MKSFPAITFEPVTVENRAECEGLRVSTSQREFLPDNGSSIDLATRYAAAEPMLVRNVDGQAVGFALFGIDENSGEWKIFRLMVDEQFQRRGYGRAILRDLIERLRREHQAPKILMVYHAPNIAARQLYAAEGFVEYDRVDGKVLSKIECD
jgi:diamine N-acetyltransferase